MTCEGSFLSGPAVVDGIVRPRIPSIHYSVQMIANPGNPSSHAARPAALRLAVFPELDAPAEQGGGPLRPLTLRPQTGWLRAETCPGGNVTVTFACMSKSKEEKSDSFGNARPGHVPPVRTISILPENVFFYIPGNFARLYRPTSDFACPQQAAVVVACLSRVRVPWLPASATKKTRQLPRGLSLLAPPLSEFGALPWVRAVYEQCARLERTFTLALVSLTAAMANDHRGGGRGYLPPRDPRDLSREESQYPPPPGEEDDPRSAPAHPPMNRGPVTLPSIQDTYSAYAPTPSTRPYHTPPAPAPALPPSDPRAVLGYAQQSSPPNANGYPAPAPPPHQYPLPAVHPSGDTRQPPQQYSDFYAQQQRPPYDPYGFSRYSQAPPPVAFNGYDYPRVGTGAAAQQAQAAPRQRTSIACRYCRKRKIRCSGYQNTNNGKCNNCDKLRIECIFQPVSSNASTAFVPVSALQGAQQGHAHSRNGQYTTSPHEYGLASPTATPHSPLSFDERSDAGRWRARLSDEEHALRLPPPNLQQEDDLRRRSPAIQVRTSRPTSTSTKDGLSSAATMGPAFPVAGRALIARPSLFVYSRIGKAGRTR
ncbi:hypothetical protein P8C59_009584 [Phyllachora maydis]|uniref:Zn(2)-C6 fungal-type domain-containing protein n=1 Tax=Phyllachora maydis TaxID=1825666 RepID=A0AAD9IFM2_9PEZI|nr:hypothetical protein P8C59_009584 [Phyllachora maydis]